MSSVDIELFSDKELLDELLGRFEHASFIGMKVNELGDETHGYTRRWKGNSHVLAGLCIDMSGVILAEFHQREVAG